MAIYPLDALTRVIHPDAFVNPDAVVIGAVEIGAGLATTPHRTGLRRIG